MTSHAYLTRKGIGSYAPSEWWGRWGVAPPGRHVGAGAWASMLLF